MKATYDELKKSLASGMAISTIYIKEKMDVSYRLAGEWLIELINHGLVSLTPDGRYKVL